MKDKKLLKQLETFDGTKVNIRPSSVDTWTNCPRQWAMVFIGGESSIPGARAALGTAVHTAIETEWNLSIAAKAKQFNVSAMEDIVSAELVVADNEGLSYDNDDNLDTLVSYARLGVNAFVDDILPFTDIPLKAETRLGIDVKNPIIEKLTGTIDYLGKSSIADVKTSKRKPIPQSFVVQQSIYKLLAEANDMKIDDVFIQGIVFNKTKTYGTILPLEPNLPRAKYLVNSILDTLTVYNEQKIDPTILFRGNPKYYLCSIKYCKFYSTCPYVNGEL